MSTFIEDLSEKTALNDNDLGIIADSQASNQNKKFKFSSLWTWIKSKLFNSSSLKLKNYARVVLNPNAFTHGVANERVNIKIPIGDVLSCQIKVKGSANYSYSNASGVLEKTYNLGSNGSSFWLNIGSYTQIDGAISYWLSFGDIYSSNGYFNLPIIKRDPYTDVFSLTIILEFEGLLIPSDAMIEGICSGGVYISSEPIPSENRLGTKGYNVLDSGHPEDQPTFQQLTLSYPADSDYEAVRADKEIVISTSSDNNALQVQGGTERTRKMSQSLGFILSLVQSDLVLGANTNGCQINNGSSVLLGDTNASIDLPQRIDQGSDFNVRSLNIGDNDNNELYGAVANGKEAFARNIGEQAMCSGNAPLDTVFSGGVKANTNNVHMEGVLQLPNDDFNTAELIPAMTGTLTPTVTTLNYIDFNYGFSERLKHIGYELNIVLDFLNGTGLYDSCTLNFNGMIVIDDLSAVSHTYKQNDSFSHNYAGNDLITESIFRNVELQLDFGSTPANFRIYPKLKINSIETTSNDWFSNVHTTQNVIGDGGGYIISSWKWEFNSIQSSEKIVFMSKKK